ncbi:hypothetical protein INT44_004449 [Umbelopsis vinacea]|uniref:Uncharacterized protein n=1 Tax=Umbelopsis vinacea TaxID=44442 RepID=A0A8H7UPH7_9FUNG|nr:hypothetical protein INT44_004449 [Umbelopsis vinacea]
MRLLGSARLDITFSMMEPVATGISCSASERTGVSEAIEHNDMPVRIPVQITYVFFLVPADGISDNRIDRLGVLNQVNFARARMLLLM